MNVNINLKPKNAGKLRKLEKAQYRNTQLSDESDVDLPPIKHRKVVI